ncbi:sigma 54-interacting transcriptional regulator [Fictibacillus sp. WQ 8-8]|uniref:sigma-54 interaction domain-containing protein n=1 Tax=Fictibacillus sp. WQ 8-8 TaxID=2938788 RepID=UPI00210D6013|nr:sigma 54-interacting transcriptional regulator [Fictibacillus sp. WQ 8-8]MCQ6268124.1 sigma 54-interacting transcriptional regulator [Fictibacillus sp. WQ 8-8]
MVSSKTNEVLLQNIINYSFDEIFITDASGTIIHVSPSCKEIYGVSAEYLMNQNVFELEKEGILNPSVTALVLKSKKIESFVQETVTERKCLVSAYPIFDENGKVIRVISFSRDITEIEHLKRRNEEVAKTIDLYKKEIAELKSNNYNSIYFINEKMKSIFDIISKVADLDVIVLLEGESGVGKNRVAKIIHELSERKKAPFVEINCGAIPESLIESELFGYEEGAFTGAKKGGKKGYFELAESGTLFLDEIAELPINLQVKLLSVLQNQTITRIGGSKKINLHCRIICATNQNLEKCIEEKRFREDLYYRINVIKIVIPPLRERREDISFLINEIAEEFNVKYKINKRFSPKMIAWLIQQDWPGNVRELRNFIEKTFITTNEEIISMTNVFIRDRIEDNEAELTLASYIERVEKEYIKGLYKKYPSSIKLAKILGISQSTANRKIQKYIR